MNWMVISTLGFLIGLTNAQFNANLYLSSLEPSQEHPPALSTPELNAILSLKLNISQFENLPASLHPTTPKAQLVLGHTNSDIPSTDYSKQSKLFIAIYGNDGQTLLPAEFIGRSQTFSIPNPPDKLSFDALISIYIGRIVDSLRLPIHSIFGVKDFLQAYHDAMGLKLATNLEEWAADWADSIPDWIQWLSHIPEKPVGSSSPNDSINPEVTSGERIKEYGVLDAPAYQLIDDLKSLDEFLNQSSWGLVSFLRLSGLHQVRQRHGESSLQYRTCQAALKASLKAVLLDGRVAEMETMVIGVPAQQTYARLGKRTDLSILSPFKTSEQSFVRRELLERRRSVFGTQASMPIIPSSRKCFATKAECQSSTSACNGHGACVQGQKTSGGKCFVCACQKSSDVKSGQVTYWSGDSCQKKDISSGFVLLLGSAIGLLIFFALAVRLLASVGSENLPQQLASIHGHSKKVD